MAQEITDNRRSWTSALQQSKRPSRRPGRAIHFGRTEAGPRVALKKLPAGFAERVYEQKVLTSPGVAEGFEHANDIIEGWKKSL